MDLRKQRTKIFIHNAFMEIRSHKPIHKITVQELCEKALIHKATFYNHYHDIYALNDELKNELITEIIDSASSVDKLISSPKEGTAEFTEIIIAKLPQIKLLFADDRESDFTKKLENALENTTTQSFPHRKDSLKANIVRSVITQGCFYAVVKYQDVEQKLLIKILSDICEAILSI
ncbi:MAG: TetR/AcrR family transcriptional regulator [Clostridia bacterium]|nr:TetR/AcrR family transcriptional regulator [Clostridia bacterium]